MICHTIGYGNRSFEDFFKLLCKHEISHVIDVRSYPHSEREEFNAEYLMAELPKRELKYTSCPHLGGIRKIPYHKYMESKDFEKAISLLYSMIEKENQENAGIALMCAEKNPRNCHRHFIAQELEKRGVRMIHITEPGQTSLEF
ncbi:uncharacterized protein (DUF488 family) [Methanohalophilus levihalophilus]|uniref:DUF488 domain-containing protein n=1 Tax=Methanohalophilus levihalophilus TaxID=1431282 RepID=UPI001AE7266D|nr:DUF488 domain-containing protein [Methanohalophilus levihalophilus]MBP2030523.1 uncharacterized protein (DUF488 family) [Methanohalophilus levihalophilus]